MASNKVQEYTSPVQIAVPAALAFPVVLSNAPVLLGTLPGVGNCNDGDSTRAANGTISIDTTGAFNLTVVAKSSLSPSTGSAVNPGDKIYADGGTTDATTGVTSGFTLDKNTGGTVFGIAISTSGQTGSLLASGTTGTIAVLLKGTL